MGSDVLVDVHLVVKPEISVSEGHQVGMQVLRRMREALPEIRDINFHIDAENDQQGTITTQELPSRKAIRNWLHDQVPELNDSRHHLRLHYLGNQVHVELFLDEALPEALTGHTITQRLDSPAWLATFRIWQPG